MRIDSPAIPAVTDANATTAGQPAQAATDDDRGAALATSDSSATKALPEMAFANSVAFAAPPPQLNLASFLSGFKAGDALAIDGPGWMNGAGKITKLDADHLAMTFNISSVGAGSLSLDRASGNTFTMTVTNGDSKHSYNLVQTKDDDTYVMTDTSNANKKFNFSMDDGTFNINPDGFSLPGSFDVTKK